MERNSSVEFAPVYKSGVREAAEACKATKPQTKDVRNSRSRDFGEFKSSASEHNKIFVDRVSGVGVLN